MRRNAGLLIVAAVLGCASTAFPQNAASKMEMLKTPVVRAVEAAGPAVVNISTEKVVTTASHENLRKLFEQQDQYFERFKPLERSGRSLGSGVIVDSRGYVLTNEHVVQRATKINIRLKDKRMFQARLISVDPEHDLAVIKIVGDGPFPTVNLFRTTPLMVGETVIAVGNPFGLEHTVTTGVLSATDRRMSVPGRAELRGLIQTDAAINPGNSGGALLDLNGDLVGINTAIKSEGEGMGFAVPVDQIRRELFRMLDFGRISKLWVGVTGFRVRLDARTMEPVALEVTGVQPASPAAKAGLRRGDFIVRLGDRRCVDPLQFQLDILERKPGDVVTVGYFREGKSDTAQITVERLPMTDPATVIRGRLGLAVRPIDPEEAKGLDLDQDKGLVIEEVVPKGPADVKGLKKGDVISIFATYRVEDLESLYSVLESVRGGEMQVIVLYRKGTKYYTWIQPN